MMEINKFGPSTKTDIPIFCFTNLHAKVIVKYLLLAYIDQSRTFDKGISHKTMKSSIIHGHLYDSIDVHVHSNGVHAT